MCSSFIPSACRPLRRNLIPISALVLLSGCSASEQEPQSSEPLQQSEPVEEKIAADAASEPAPGTSTASPPTPSSVQSVLLGGKLADEVERFNPAVDGWQSESFNDAAQKQLNFLAKQLVQSLPVSTTLELSEYFTSDYASPPLRPEPATQKLLFEDRNFVVRSEPEGWSPVGNNNPEQSMLEFVEPLREFSDVRIKFKSYRVALGDDSSTTATTRVLVSTLGRSPGSGSFEQHANWGIEWDRSRPVPRIRSISPTNYREGATQGKIDALFSDCTKSVLAQSESYEKLLRPGLDDWAARMHNQLGIESEGYQGMALGDVNGDELDDLYLCQPGGLPNQLFLRNPDGTLREAPEGHGTDWLERSRSALFIDLDNDLDQDLVVLCNTRAILMENDGTGVFEQRHRLQLPGSPFSCAAADYDSDGDLDLYVCNYGDLWGGFGDLNERFPIPYHDANNGGPNALFQNNGDWQFSNVTKAVGMEQNNRRWSLSCAWEDFDNDGDADLYVANDFGRNNLFRNDGGSFTDIAAAAGVEDISPGMSVTWGDVNRDGLADVYVSNMFSGAGNRITFQDQFLPGADAESKGHFQRFARGNALFLNQGDGTFRDSSEASRVTVGRWAWASRMADFNNDGLEDIVVANGFLTQEDGDDL